MMYDIRNINIGVEGKSYYFIDNLDNYFTFNYFREGISDEELFNNDINVSLKCINEIDVFTINNNNIINYFKMNANKYNSYFITDGSNYTKKFTFNEDTNAFTTMVRGSISGKVNLKSCGVNSNDIEMLVYRRPDRQFIGTYAVKEDGTYLIPNLDSNTAYDIIMFDTTQKLEQQVHSMRYPLPSTYIPQIKASKPIDFKIEQTDEYYIFSFRISKELYSDYKYCNLIYTSMDGLEENMLVYNILGTQVEIDINSPIIKNGMYKIESVFNNLTEYSISKEIIK